MAKNTATTLTASDELPVQARGGDSLWSRIWEARWMYVFIAPPVIAFLVFFIYPALFALYSSFFKFNHFKFLPLDSPFDNYTRALRDPQVRRGFLNVIELFLLSFFPGQALSLFVAVLLNNLKKAVGFFRTIYYLPMVTSTVVVSALFRWIMRSDAGGFANVLLYKLTGLGPIRWLWQEALVVPSIALISVWSGVGGGVIIWTAGLKGIPRELYEAATIDGANRWQQFWKVTLPMLKPIALYNLVMGFIGGMKAFGLNLVLTGGGPGYASTTPVLIVYQYGFGRLQMGYASAVAYILSIVLMAISLLQFKWFGNIELYD